MINLKHCIISRPSIKWYLDGIDITETRNAYKTVQDGETYKLIFGSVTTEMHGNYKCVVRNDYGKIEDECNVIVNCKFNAAHT